MDEIQKIKKEISFAARILNSDRPLDWEDRDAALKSLGHALEKLDELELSMMPEVEEVFV